MERCSISPHIGFIPLWSFLLVTVIFCTATGDPNDRKWEELGDMQMPVTAQATTTQLWAVDWGPTQPPEEETHHFLSSLETENLKMTTSEDLSHHRGKPANQTQQPTTGEEERKDTEQETQEVDPQFYVTVTISSLLVLSAVIISAKLCYDRSLSHGPPPLSLAIPRAIAQEDSRQTLHITPSFPDRERIPVVNL